MVINKNKFALPETLGELREILNDLWRDLPDETPLLNYRKYADYRLVRGMDLEQVNVVKGELIRYGIVSYDEVVETNPNTILGVKFN
jgi:hypothetical protein